MSIHGSKDTSTISRLTVARLADAIGGRVISPDSSDYESARRVWNYAIDRRPAAIVRCQSADDVARTIGFARDQNLPIAIRGGGHGVAGLAVCDGGIVIDLMPMKKIQIDRERRIAHAGAGLTLGEFDSATQAVGLATTLGTAPPTGISGLTLGGGYGWLMGKHGLACDNVLGAEMVTADADVRYASAGHSDDLFWAIRGGGGNFGVVTRLDYQLHPRGPVLGGMVVHPLSRVREVFEYYREFTAAAPDDLTAFAGMMPSPDGASVAAILVCWSGELEEGERVLAPVRKFGPPLADMIRPIPYVEMQKLLDVAPGPLCGYWKGGFLRELSDGAIEALLRSIERSPGPSAILALEHFHGAVSRVAPEATAFSHRTTSHNVLLFTTWTEPKDADRNIGWARDSWKAIRAFGGGGVYVNALADDGADRIAEAYGPNLTRLRAIKRKYDPDNVFRLNQNIAPTG